MLSNIPEVRRFHLPRIGSLNSDKHVLHVIPISQMFRTLKGKMKNITTDLKYLLVAETNLKVSKNWIYVEDPSPLGYHTMCSEVQVLGFRKSRCLHQDGSLG
jgi:hypothetical protein